MNEYSLSLLKATLYEKVCVSGYERLRNGGCLLKGQPSRYAHDLTSRSHNILCIAATGQ
jgi:hypothetical protein